MLKSKTKLLHKTLAVVLTFSLLASLVSFKFVSATSGDLTGSGTASSPYEIYDYQDLQSFATIVNDGTKDDAYAVLKNDIVITGSWTPIGNSKNTYKGVFNGKDTNTSHKITFASDATFSDSNLGFYGVFGINEGTIKNLTVEGSDNYILQTSEAEAFIGGVAGLNIGTISNCKNSVNVKSTGIASYAGGIAGVMESGIIDTCTNTGSVNVTVDSHESTDIRMNEAPSGGIVAFNYNGTIKKSTNTGSVSSNETLGYTGGIAGSNNGIIENCLNNGAVSNDNANEYIGGIVGMLFTNSETGANATVTNSLSTSENNNIYGTNATGDNIGIVTNCFYKANESITNDNGTTGVTEAELSSGEITYKLNGNSSANPVWGQSLTTDSYPSIGSTNIVYKIDNTYVNNKPQCTHNYENGVCPVCGDIAAKVHGYTLTVDGAIGLNYYIIVANEYASSLNKFDITFVKDGKDITTVSAIADDTNSVEGFQTYKATVSLDSDQMNCIINAKFTINDNINVISKDYSINDYLIKIHSDPTEVTTENADKLKILAQDMYTYGYYANEYFKENQSYYPDITLNKTNTPASAIDSNKYAGSYGTEDITTITHYASSLQHVDQIKTVFYVNGSSVTDPENTRMQYNKVSVDGNNTILPNTTETVTIGKRGSEYYGLTNKIPIAELKDTKFAVTFGTINDEGAYTQQSKTKYYAPYTYIRNIFLKYENDDTNNLSYKLTQALYHYSEAANAYFNASSQS